MRPLSSSLLSAQKSSTRKPILQVVATNKLAGVVNVRPVRLYTGSEEDGPHSLALAGDGSMVRVRISSASDNRKLYLQRVTGPGPLSDFSAWIYLSQYGIMACALCLLGAHVSLFWAHSDGEIDYQESSDHGLTWGFTEYLGYGATGDITQMAAAYKPNGDLVLFFTDLNTVSFITRNAGVWDSRDVWDKSTGDLTGIAAVYDADFELLVSGKDLDGNFKIWSLVYGDGGAVTAGTWSDLHELAASPAGGDYEFGSVFLDSLVPSPSPETYNSELITYNSPSPLFRCFYTEKFTGVTPYDRPFWSHTLPGTAFADGRWKEPAPFDTESPFGIAIAHRGNDLWLEMPSGVWRGSLAEISSDLSADILSARADLGAETGNLLVELANGRQQYAEPGVAGLAALAPGCEISFSPGYHTSAIGNELSVGQHFILRDWEYQTSPGKSSFVLYASDGWSFVDEWTARFQFRWNQPDAFGSPTTEASVIEILAQILARAGLRLDIISHSAVASGFFPDFTVHPGETGRAVINRLLTFIPDMLVLEGDTVYLVNPLTIDAPVYAYVSPFGEGGLRGISDHLILEGRYLTAPMPVNRVKAGGDLVTAECSAWEDIQRRGEVLQVINDLNLLTEAEALQRAASLLRRAEIATQSGSIRIPVNCGQQLLDVVAITDPRADLAAVNRRILAISLSYIPSKAHFEQILILGGV